MKNILDGSSLIMLIGPTGAGKSTWARKNFKKDEIISSDDIRIEVGESCGLSRNNMAELLELVWKHREQKVKQEYENRVRLALKEGKRVVAEASHLRKRDRTSISDIALLLNLAVTYMIFDRSLEDKLKTAGWRAEIPTLIEQQHQMFYDNEAG